MNENDLIERRDAYDWSQRAQRSPEIQMLYLDSMVKVFVVVTRLCGVYNIANSNCAEHLRRGDERRAGTSSHHHVHRVTGWWSCTPIDVSAACFFHHHGTVNFD